MKSMISAGNNVVRSHTRGVVAHGESCHFW